MVTSKLWNTDHSAEHVEAACRRSLADLQLDYLDLYLIHFPIRCTQWGKCCLNQIFYFIILIFSGFSLKHVPPEVRYPPGWVADPAQSQQMEVVSVPVLETWTAMESLVHRGLVRWWYLCFGFTFTVYYYC